MPLAFRTGSREKQRIHIFWQARTRGAGDTTPHWFPSQTNSGAIREDRLVVPIPVGTHWRDAKPVLLPGIPVPEQAPPAPKTLPGGAPIRPRPEQPKYTAAQQAAIQRTQSRHLRGVPLGKKAVITAGGIKYVDRTDYVPETDAPEGMEPAPSPSAPPSRAPRTTRSTSPRRGSCATATWSTSTPTRRPCRRARGSTT